ncbi:Alpha/Beta hydrolase fold [Sesbania bispinosa]|nr:Alpha/Beta hydrolase fold [Sesbania bispinosa]
MSNIKDCCSFLFLQFAAVTNRWGEDERDTCTFYFEGIARKLASSGYGVFAMDYPGFGLQMVFMAIFLALKICG